MQQILENNAITFKTTPAYFNPQLVNTLLIYVFGAFLQISFFFFFTQNPGLPIQKLQDIQRAMELLSCQGPAKSIDDAAKHKYQFWDTQPVPKLSECRLKLNKVEERKTAMFT